MPRVPVYDNFDGVSQRPVAQERFSNTLSQEQATIGGRQMQEAGNTLASAGAKLFEQQVKVQEQANTLRVIDARNQAKELAYKLRFSKDEGYSNIYGVDALQRESGMPLSEEYLQKYQEGVGKIYDALGNDAQKKEFSRYAQEGAIDFQGQVMAHQVSQFREYASSVHNATIKNAMNDIVANYNNIDAVNRSVEQIQASAYEQAKLNNQSSTFADTAAREMTSKAHLAAIKTAIDKNDPTFADGYLKKYTSGMNADDILSANGLITKQMNSRIAVTTADKVMSEVLPKITNPPLNRAFNILINAESAGKQFAPDGSPLTSGKGAIGIAQVMPKTAPEAAKLAGLEWSEEKYKNDAQYNRQLGKAYFEKQLKDFGGDLAQAYAAYNYGPTATREAIQRAEKEGKDWRDFIPEETKKYVANNVKAFESGGGSESAPSLAEIKKQVRDLVGVDNPERLKLAMDEVERRYVETEKLVKQRADEAVAGAMQAIMENGGRYVDLPAQLRAAIPPDRVGKVLDFAAKWGRGEDVETDWALYYDLRRDPKSLLDANLMVYRERLSDTEFKELTRLQANARQNPDYGGVLRTHKDVMNQFLLESLGYYSVSPKEAESAKGKTRSAVLGRVWQAFDTRVQARQDSLGRALTNEELKKEAAALFTPVNLDGWFSNAKPAVLVSEDDAVLIPEEDRRLISEGLTAAKRPVTEESIRAVYLIKKMGGV